MQVARKPPSLRCVSAARAATVPAMAARSWTTWCRMTMMPKERWAQVIIYNGVPSNNWNLIQADLISKIAAVLGDNDAYADRRGKQYYQNLIVNESSERQWALSRLASYGFDAATHIWNKSPGYYVGYTLIHFAR